MLTIGESGTLTTYLALIGSGLGTFFGWIHHVGEAITSDGTLFYSLIVFGAGSLIGIFGRLLSRR